MFWDLNLNPYACRASAYLTLSHFPSLCLISSRKIPGEDEQPGVFGSGIIAELLKDLEPLGSAVMSPGRGEFVEMSPGKRESALFNGFSSCILVNFLLGLCGEMELGERGFGRWIYWLLLPLLSWASPLERAAFLPADCPKPALQPECSLARGKQASLIRMLILD